MEVATEGELVRSLRFIQYDEGNLRVVRTEPLRGDQVEHQVQRVARDFLQQGLILTDDQSRSITPAQCLRSALNDDQLAIYLVPAHRRNHMYDIECAMKGVKRPGSHELDDSSRPHKLQILGRTQPEWLVAVDRYR